VNDKEELLSLTSDHELRDAISSIKDTNHPLRIVVTRAAEEIPEVRSNIPLSNESMSNHEIPAPVYLLQPIVHGVNCNYCGLPILGVRYKCVQCHEYNLCSHCETFVGAHPIDHPLIKAKVPLPCSFQPIHALSSGLLQCGDHLSRAITREQFMTTKQGVQANLSLLGEEMINQLYLLSETVKVKATEFKEEISTLLHPDARCHQLPASPSPVIPQTDAHTTEVAQIDTQWEVLDPPMMNPEIARIVEMLQEMGFTGEHLGLIVERHRGDLNASIDELQSH